MKINKNKSKSNQGNRNNKNSGDILRGSGKYNNNNKNSISNYRTKKKNNISKNDQNKNEFEAGVKRNDFVGVTKPASMFVTTSKFNPSKKLIPNQNEEYSSSSSSSSLGLSESESGNKTGLYFFCTSMKIKKE